MIARHVQDPIKAWGREKHLWPIANERLATLVEVQVGHIGPLRRESATTLVGSDVNGLDSSEDSGPALDVSLRHISLDDNKTVAIYFCSAGTIAEKLANKLHKWMIPFVDSLSHVSCTAVVEPLDRLKASDLTPDKIFLLVVSSTGHGEIPANGLAFEEMCHHVQAQNLSACTEGFKFAIFGNGDSRYSSTYNEAAYIINGLMKQVGGLPLTSGIRDGDTAAETLPLGALHSWWEEIKPIIRFRAPSPLKDDEPTQDAIQQYEDHQESLLTTLKDATLVIQAPKTGPECARSLLLSLDIQSETYEEMSCIQVLPCNSPTKVGRALQALCVEGSDQMNLVLDGEDPTFSTFLTSFVDLELPFLDLEWLSSIPLSGQRNLNADALSHLSVAEVLERIVSTEFVQENSLDYCLQRDICLAMPLLNVKTYSIASSLSYASFYKGPAVLNVNELQIMVKIQENGRFSDTFLHDCAPPRFLKYRFIDSVVGSQLRENHLAPMIVVATGAGFGPVRCLLQWRIATARNAIKAGYSAPLPNKGISLFLGLKECDIDLVKDVIEEAESYGILDMTEIVLSNPAKRRVYDKLRDHSKHIRGKVVKKKGLVFVCAGSAAAEATKGMFEKVIGSSVEKMIGDRYLEDVF